MKKLRHIEKQILLYFNMTQKGCREYVKSCDYTPYYCGYSEPRKGGVNTYELCLFVTGKIRCPGEIERYYIDKHSKSSYRSILRAVEGLEKKGYIRKATADLLTDTENKWYLTYTLAEYLLMQ